MNPLTALPPNVRALGYYLFAVGSVAVTYCAAKGYLGAEEVAAWVGIGAVFGFTAGANTATRGERGAVDVGTAVLIGILVLLVLVVIGVIR